MTRETSGRISPYISFSLYFFIAYGCWGTINSYLPVYFNSFSFSNTEIGVLSAVGPFGALFGLIFWGMRADRAKLRNNVMLLLCALLGVLSQLYLLGQSFAWIFMISVAFMFCFYSLSPVGDSMYVEYAQQHKMDYGKSRIWGSIGLALLPLVPGWVVSRFGIRMMFPVYLGFLLLLALFVMMMPKMEGGQSRSGKRLNLLALRRDKELTGLICFLLLLHTTLGFYYSFFPVHMNNLGATDLISVNNLLQFCSEIVFVWFVTGLVRRFGFDKLFVVAFLLTALRLLLIGLIKTPALYLLVNLVGGLGYSMCMMLFVLYVLKVPAELRTSAQMLIPITAHSISRFLGSIAGGALSDLYSIPAVFTGTGIFDLFLTVGFLCWTKRTNALKGRLLM